MQSAIPLHVGIIPDGNRRWAKRNGVSLLEAYMRGYRKVVEVTEYLYDRGVRVVSVYGLSRENCIRRSNGERRIIEEVAVYALRDLRRNPKLRRLGVTVRILGRPGLFSDRLLEEARETMRSLDGGRGGTLAILLCYSGSWEALEYSSRGLSPASLLALPPLDLVIRTGGAHRLSGFLPCLAEYAELYFTETLWPDITFQEVDRALKWFSRQKRNFGR